MTKWFKEHIPTLTILGLLVATALTMIIFGDPQPLEKAVISGSINLNGVGSQIATNKGNIVLMQRQHGRSDFVTTNLIMPLADEQTWSWTEAKSGVTYDLQSDLFFNGQHVASSNILTVTAPATDQVFTFNIQSLNLAEDVIPETKAIITGKVFIDGFIPDAATISIFASGQNLQDTEQVITNLTAQTITDFAWEGALSSQEYQLEARLINADGTPIGTSQKYTLVAPAKSEILQLSSQATPPPLEETSQTASIAGEVHISGPLTANSSVLLLQRTIGETNFTAFDRLNPTVQLDWILPNLTPGQKLEITALLQVNEQNTATGEIITPTAPASNQIINLDTGLNLSNPL